MTNLIIDIADPKSINKTTDAAQDKYFTCIEQCSLDDNECEDSCTDQLKIDDSIHS